MQQYLFALMYMFIFIHRACDDDYWGTRNVYRQG